MTSMFLDDLLHRRVARVHRVLARRDAPVVDALQSDVDGGREQGAERGPEP